MSSTNPNHNDAEQHDEAIDEVLSDEAGADDLSAATAESASPPLSAEEELQRQLKEANDRVLRTQAELENYRKRAQREMAEDRKYASISLLRDLLGVADNLNRAIEAAEQSEETSSLLDGVKMVSAQLINVLDQHQCKPINALGSEFDPNLHEAVAQQPSDEHDAGIVTMVATTGYQLHDRVVRPAQVLVSTGKAES